MLCDAPLFSLSAQRPFSCSLPGPPCPLPSLRFPAYGAVVSKELESPRDLPPFVAVPDQSPGPITGYLGLEKFSLGSELVAQAFQAGRQ